MNNRIEYLAGRIKGLAESEDVSVTELKSRLNCRSTELLMSIGFLMPSSEIEVKEDGWNILVSLKQDVKEKRD